MLFELINAFAIFQKIINNTLREYFDVFVIVYLNNILIYSKTLKKHVKHIQKILTCLIKKIYNSNQKNVNFIKKKSIF